MHFFFHQQLNRKPHVHVRPVTTYSNSYKSSTACISNGGGLESIQDFNFRCAFKLKVRLFGLVTDVVARCVAGSLPVLAVATSTQSANTRGQLRSKQMAWPLGSAMILYLKGIFLPYILPKPSTNLYTLVSFL